MKNRKTIAMVAVVTVIIIAVFYRLSTNEGALRWVTKTSQHPTDIIKSPSGEYRVRGVKPESVKGFQNPQTPAVVQQPQIDPVYDQTIQRGVITNFPVGVWVTVYKNFIPGTSVLTSFDTDAELVMYKVRFGGVVMTNYASCYPENVRSKNSSDKANLEVVSNTMEVQMLPGQRYNRFVAVWWRE
jgi:hypothetical protein